MYLLALVSLISLAAICLAAYVAAAASRRHKGIAGELHIIGARGSVVEALRPEGAVLIEGELWRARSRSGAPIAGGKVTVSGVSGHLLEVE